MYGCLSGTMEPIILCLVCLKIELSFSWLLDPYVLMLQISTISQFSSGIIFSVGMFGAAKKCGLAEGNILVSDL